MCVIVLWDKLFIGISIKNYSQLKFNSQTYFSTANNKPQYTLTHTHELLCQILFFILHTIFFLINSFFIYVLSLFFVVFVLSGCFSIFFYILYHLIIIAFGVYGIYKYKIHKKNNEVKREIMKIVQIN